MTASDRAESDTGLAGLFERVGVRAFAHLRGLLGRLGGRAMTQSRPVQAWVLDLLELQRGDIGSLAFPTGSFTKLYTVNCLPFRPSVPQGLAELRRVLVPEGRAVIAVRLYREGTGRANPSAYGFTDDELAELVTAVAHADLGRVTADRHERPRETIAALVSGA